MDTSVIRMDKQKLQVPDFPSIVYIEGDGVGREITPVALAVIDAAVKHAYGTTRAIGWKECLAGEKAFSSQGAYLPQDTLDAIDESLVAIKGPLTTPVGKGFRSLNVTLRQKLDLYACVRPVRYFTGVPSPVRHPELVDMVVFRENTEDIYAGIEWPQGSSEAALLRDFLEQSLNVTNIRFPESSAFGIKPVSVEGSKRLVRSAIHYALEQSRTSVTLVHKGNIMKFTEGGFLAWGYEVAKDEFGAIRNEKGHYLIERTGQKPLIVKDCICDAFLQNILIKSSDYDVVATTNLNGDYVSDALAAEVGGIGIAPGANINYLTGKAIFEATHGTAPDIAGNNSANPLSMILSGEMLLRYLGWNEAAATLIRAIELVLQDSLVTADFYRLIKQEGNDATLLGTKEFGDYLISRM